MLEADLQMFSSLPESDAANPELALRRGLTLAALGRWVKACGIFGPLGRLLLKLTNYIVSCKSAFMKW